MSIFRPSNINKRLVGFGATITPSDSRDLRSPGNAGQIGPKKTPYLYGTGTAFTLGYAGDGGSCGGVFRTNESNCGVQRFYKQAASSIGGFLICKASPVRWIVAPMSAEVSRDWYSRDDASTRAQQVSGCTGWFVPTNGQLQNPGYTCRTYWDSFSSYGHWSSTEINATCAWNVNMISGGLGLVDKSVSFCVRSFRCVTY